MRITIPLVHIQIPRINCKGKCQSSCGPIMASERERHYFESQSGKKFPDAEKLITNSITTGEPLECPYLSPLGQCDVYQFRPTICRLWGNVEGMPCPWGCNPSPLSDVEGRRLLDAAE